MVREALTIHVCMVPALYEWCEQRVWSERVVVAPAGERYLSTVMMASARDECERMGVNERVLLSDQAGSQFYVPPLSQEVL